MNFAAFDLNLLRVFQALMIERHVTRAGQRIGLSQPAVSAALNRLRAIFADELFIRTAGNMLPTPRALELADPIGDALRRIEQAVGSTVRFDPATERRDFALLGIDYFSYLLAPPLFAELQNTAPGIMVRFVDARTGPIPQLLEEGRVDLAFEVMHELPDPARSQFLLQERYVVIIAADHPDADVNGAPGSTFDLDLYCRLPHVLHSLVGGATGNVDAALAAVKRERRVALSLPHFFSIAGAVAKSRMIATYPERLARSVAPLFGLRIHRPPVELAPISLAMIWHRRNDGEAGHVWLRQQLMKVAQGLA
ncbi:MAG TPA: LysR family transcriptional regulator [Xanthobacteraceae bacterium]|nr:LysR family transcriptional regulator [Xanthobacteraceae bacterium]